MKTASAKLRLESLAEIPLVDLKAQHRALREEFVAAFCRHLDQSDFVKGRVVDEFERTFASYLGVREVVGVGNGTDALILSLKALGIGAGDEVIVPAMTFIATAEAVVAVGARPRFADVDPTTLTITPQTVDRVLGQRTRAIIPVHLYGHPADPPGIVEIGKFHGVDVVFDAAQAHGASWRGRSVAEWGRASCYSFYPGKNLGALGDGGAVASQDPDFAAQVRLLADHGRQSKYEHLIPGYNSRLDSIQAAWLGVKLRYLQEWTARRVEAARRYRQLLADCPMVRPLAEPREAGSVYHLFVVRVPQRDTVLERLRAAGIGAGVHYPIPLHKQPAFAGADVSESCRNAEQAAAEVLSLPLFPEITAEIQEHVVSVLQEAAEKAQ